MLETILKSDSGVPALLGAICVLMTLHLFTRLGTFLWEMLKQKSAVSEQSIQRLIEAVNRLEDRVREADVLLRSIPKISRDLKQAFMAIKILAGDNWSHIRDEIAEDSDVIS